MVDRITTTEVDATMTCQYCRAQIEVDAHRCNRCGRRTMDRTPVQMTAAVPNLETVEMLAPVPAAPRPQLVTAPPAARTGAQSHPGIQANLFGLAEAKANQAQASASSSRRKSMPRPRKNFSQQQALNFQDVRTLNNAVQASVYCGAQVALPAHRVMAGAIDIGLALAALGVFLVTFHYAGANIVLNETTVPFYLAAAALISLFYRALFCIANCDTPGVLWTGLRVLDFDGRTPTPRQRWFRLLGGFLGAISAGIGLLWAVVDEERLTWHDHMSKTFPTPRFQ